MWQQWRDDCSVLQRRVGMLLEDGSETGEGSHGQGMGYVKLTQGGVEGVTDMIAAKM